MTVSLSALAPGALVTVVGGSGFLGRYIVQRLAEAGLRVRVAVRHPETALFLKPLGSLGQVQLVRGDITSDAQMAAAFDGAAAGVNLVGILAESGKQRFDAVQAEGAGRAARAAAAAGVRHYVQVSAIGADTASPVPAARRRAKPPCSRRFPPRRSCGPAWSSGRKTSFSTALLPWRDCRPFCRSLPGTHGSSRCS
jgi:NADH dehydrogenase